MYIAIAFMYLGVIPRYATPSFVFLFPLVGDLWNRMRYDRKIASKYKKWMLLNKLAFCFYACIILPVSIVYSISGNQVSSFVRNSTSNAKIGDYWQR